MSGPGDGSDREPERERERRRKPGPDGDRGRGPDRTRPGDRGRDPERGRGRSAEAVGGATEPSFGRGRQALDALAYAVAVTAVVAGLSGVASLAVGAGLVGVKYGLFVVGILLFGVATFKLRPNPPGNDGDRESLPVDRRGASSFQAAVQRALPARYRIPPDERLSDAARLFLASLLVLATSYLMERVFGVAVGP